jgi:hypothetical protein
MLVRELRRLNIVALIAAGLFFVSTLFPWWGLDISGPTYGISYSFRWSMWNGPLVMIGPSPQAYFWVDYLNQVLSSGTSIIGTLALGTSVFAFVGRNLRRTRFLVAGLASSVMISLLYVSVVYSSVRAGLSAWSVDCISGVYGTCTDGLPPAITETWGFQTGFYIYSVGIAAAFCALVYDRWMQRTIDREAVEEFERSLHLSPRQAMK